MSTIEPGPDPDEVLALLDADMEWDTDVEVIDLTGMSKNQMLTVVEQGHTVDVTVLNDVDLSTLRGGIKVRLGELGQMDKFDHPAQQSVEGKALHFTWLACHVEYCKRLEERKNPNKNPGDRS